MTQTQTILNHLKHHGPITPLKARGVYRIERLASRIYDLKREGYNIRKNIRRDPTGGRYAEYSLA